MKLAEIERDLRDCDPKLRYWLRFQQEQIIALQQQLNQCADVLVRVVTTLENVQRVNLELNERWEKVIRGEKDESIVESVLNKPEDMN
ncbi:MAG: hypothetical protein MN733_03340 [Nitrososphaera sp.]|nr:hypothetical protein [Nitrososphaera sp.]